MSKMPGTKTSLTGGTALNLRTVASTMICPDSYGPHLCTVINVPAYVWLKHARLAQFHQKNSRKELTNTLR